MRTVALILCLLTIALLFLWAAPADLAPREALAAPEDEADVKLRVVAIGSRGDDVKRLFEYLQRYGYFASPQLEAMGLLPVTPSSPKDPSRFDKVMELGLLAYQARMGVRRTGRLDKATRTMMALPRCGFPDHGGFAAGQRTVPNTLAGKAVVTYALTNHSAQIVWAKANAALGRAARAWDLACGLRLVEAAVPRDANIWVSWQAGAHGDGRPFYGPGGKIAHAWYPWAPLSGDAHFDRAERWTLGPRKPGTHDFETIALHELGHSLGLYHSTRPDDIMRAVWPTGHAAQHTLSVNDKRRIRALYGW